MHHSKIRRRLAALGPKAERLRLGKYFPLCPRKRASLPILELLPPPALRERRHRGFAPELLWQSKVRFLQALWLGERVRGKGACTISPFIVHPCQALVSIDKVRLL